MNDATNTATDATDVTSTPLAGVEAVEQPMSRRGTVTLKVTVSATTLSDNIPSQEQVAEALGRLADGQSVYVGGSAFAYASGTRVTVTGVELVK